MKYCDIQHFISNKHAKIKDKDGKGVTNNIAKYNQCNNQLVFTLMRPENMM